MARLLLVGFTVAVLTSPAEALTIRDVIELTRAGLGDEVLLALIEVDRGIYAIDTGTLKQLKAAGVSERVIVALVRSGREPQVALPESVLTEQQLDAPPPQVVVVDHHDHSEERVREVPVAVPVPVYVPVSRSRHRFDVRSHEQSTFVPFQTGPPVDRPTQQPKTESVYWGFGGKLRPDAWKPDDRPHERRR